MQHDIVKQQDDVESRGEVEKRDEKEQIMESMRKFLATKSGEEMLDRVEKALTAYRSERQGKFMSFIYSYSRIQSYS